MTIVTVEDIDIDEAIGNIKQLLKDDASLSPALRMAVEVMIFLVAVLSKRLGLNSRNSSKPPASDFGANTEAERKKKRSANKPARQAGGQPGHDGRCLDIVSNPDETIPLEIDRRTLPPGHQYRAAGIEVRQVFSIRIKRFVTEYQAEVLMDENSDRYVASFPDQVSNKSQYDYSVKAHAVYLSQFQLIPYERIAKYFWEVVQLPLSQGSLYNFNKKAYEMLEQFDALANQRLIDASLVGKEFGYKTHLTISGPIFTRTRFVAKSPWMRLVSCQISLAYCVTIIGNPTLTINNANTHCAMPIIFGNYKEHTNKMVSTGLRT